MQLDPFEEKLILALRAQPLDADSLRAATTCLLAGPHPATANPTPEITSGQPHTALRNVAGFLTRFARVIEDQVGQQPPTSVPGESDEIVLLPGGVPVSVVVLADCAKGLAFESEIARERGHLAKATSYRTGADALNESVKITQDTPPPTATRLRERATVTKKEFLARCATAFDMGLAAPARLAILERWTDFALRSVAVAVDQSAPSHVFNRHGTRHQAQIAADVLESEVRRLHERAGGGHPLTLASDADGYALCRLAAILAHPCQECAVTEGWHHTTPAMHIHRPGHPVPPTTTSF